MPNISFAEYKVRIQQALEKVLKETPFPSETQGFTLVDGFINQLLQSELSGAFVVGGPSIPLVALVGNSTGRMYYFALKKLIPDIQL